MVLQYSQQDLHAQSLRDPSSFWAPTAASISWTKEPTSMLTVSDNGSTWKWFPGGEMNMCYECLDKHVNNGLGDVDAVICDSPITGSKERISYAK